MPFNHATRESFRAKPAGRGGGAGGAAPRSDPPPAPAPAAIPAAAALAAAAAAARPGLPRDGGRADEDPDLRVDPAATELSRREAKNVGLQVDKFGFYDCSDVSAIRCMFQNCFIAESDWILFAGEYVCCPIHFCSIRNLCFVQSGPELLGRKPLIFILQLSKRL